MKYGILLIVLVHDNKTDQMSIYYYRSYTLLTYSAYTQVAFTCFGTVTSPVNILSRSGYALSTL